MEGRTISFSHEMGLTSPKHNVQQQQHKNHHHPPPPSQQLSGGESSTTTTSKEASSSNSSTVATTNLTNTTQSYGTQSDMMGNSSSTSSKKKHHHHHSSSSGGRSKSTTRAVDVEKPKKKYLGTASNSIRSIPQAVKLSMLNSGFISIKGEDGKLLSSIRKKPVDKETFLRICDERRKFPILYKLEFQIACKIDPHSSRHATKLCNKDKNQNMKVIPFDYNRVVLEPSKEYPGDYVNASYVDSLLEPNAYIVCQGPSETTVGDFWRMMWQKQVTCIIMLTKTFDFIKVMCVQYWPSNYPTGTYGGIIVRVTKEEKLANFYIRTFKFKPEDEPDTEEREILQFHFVEWPCHSGPFPTALLDFRRRIRQLLSDNPEIHKGQTLVHCSDGGGRSGVYCEIDANLDLMDEDGLIDVFGYLKKLRNSRRGLVEDLEQIKFIYETLEEYVICRKTWFPVSELSQRLKHKSMKDPLTKINEYQREFLLICKQTPHFTIGDCAGGHRGDNRDKNRDVLVIPPDNFRPYLTSFQGNTFTDYINAIFVDSYSQSRGYIVTEWPLTDTCSYLWSLVYDYDASAVVVLSNPEPSAHYPPFWPESTRSKKYGPVFTIDHLAQNVFPNIKSWLFRINKKIVSLTELMAGVKAEPKTCKFFQLTCWPMEHKVPTSTNSLVELMNMVERWRQKTDRGPIIVISPDGRSRAGVYCAANACIEQVIQYGEVDVFTAVKTVRRHRPQLIDNMTEYKYCYDVVLHYVLHYLNKEQQQGSTHKLDKVRHSDSGY